MGELVLTTSLRTLQWVDPEINAIRSYLSNRWIHPRLDKRTVKDLKGGRYSMTKDGVVYHVVSDSVNALVIPNVLMRDVKGMKVPL